VAKRRGEASELQIERQRGTKERAIKSSFGAADDRRPEPEYPVRENHRLACPLIKSQSRLKVRALNARVNESSEELQQQGFLTAGIK
jgi:hypothetical protein